MDIGYGIWDIYLGGVERHLQYCIIQQMYS